MIHVTHVIDEAAPEEAARTLSCLLRHLPAGALAHEVAVIGTPPPGLSVPEGIPTRHVARRVSRGGFDIRPLARILAGIRPAGAKRLVHAWSAQAACPAAAATPAGCVMITTLADPDEAKSPPSWWPSPGSRPGTTNIVCTSSLTRELLARAGIQPEYVAVIGPMMDTTVGRSIRTELRRRLGLSPDARVLLTASPPSRRGGQFYAVWAAAILRQLWPTVRMIVPGRSTEQQRIRRLIENIYCPEVYRLVGDAYQPAELLAVSDVLVFPALAAVPTGWLTAAMAASVPIVASDVPCVREVVADGQTNLLCPPAQPHALATRIRIALASKETRRGCVAEAWARADYAASPELCTTAYLELYRKLAQVGTSSPPAFACGR